MAATNGKIKPIFVVGPPSSGKSYYIKELAKKEGRTLLHCPCRKDRTLREQRAIIHEWALRAEPTLLWIEGTDDLTPEAQSFLRRILETYAPSVRFCLEAHTLESIQEPILSRCEIIRRQLYTDDELFDTFNRKYNEGLVQDVFKYTNKSMRQLEAGCLIASSYPSLWNHIKTVRDGQTKITLESSPMNTYIHAINPMQFILNNYSKLSAIAKKLVFYSLINNGNLWAVISFVHNEIS
jgi:hypothetical protein